MSQYAEFIFYLIALFGMIGLLGACIGGLFGLFLDAVSSSKSSGQTLI